MKRFILGFAAGVSIGVVVVLVAGFFYELDFVFRYLFHQSPPSLNPEHIPVLHYSDWPLCEDITLATFDCDQLVNKGITYELFS